MKRVVLSLCVLALACIQTDRVRADELSLTGPGQVIPPPLVEQPRPEGHPNWSNADGGRELTPRERRQQAAAWEAAQRRQRLASAKARGISPSRPSVSAVPSMTSSTSHATRLQYGYPGTFYSVPVYR